MKFPCTIAKMRHGEGLKRWKIQFGEHPYQEIIWRRNQIENNKDISGWKSKEDARWRVVNFLEKYSIKKVKDLALLCIDGTYININHCLPEEEIFNLKDKILKFLDKQNNVKITKGGLIIYKNSSYKIVIKYISDEKTKEQYALNILENYKILDIKIYFGNILPRKSQILRPWKALKTGIRIREKRGEPLYSSDISLLKNYLPAVIDLGSGPSVELGIPPINYLYDIFNVRNIKNDQFIFGDQDNLLEEIILNTKKFLKKTSKIISTAWTAKIDSKFYSVLKSGIENGLILEPIITNNYDNILKLHQIEIENIRNFTEKNKTKIFNPLAKSLLTIGVHADRRDIHTQAREQGLKIFHVDPEQYVDMNGLTHKYILESPQDSDVIFKMSGKEFAIQFYKIFLKKKHIHYKKKTGKKIFN